MGVRLLAHGVLLLSVLQLSACMRDIQTLALSEQERAWIEQIRASTLVEVHRLDPYSRDEIQASAAGFGGWTQLSSGTPAEADAAWLKRQILAMLRSKPQAVAMCFDPHHAVTLVLPDTGRRVRVAVCFDCSNLAIEGGGIAAFAGGDEARWDDIFEAAGAGPRPPSSL